MQGYIEEDPNFDKVKNLTAAYIDEIVALTPGVRIIITIEHPVIKHVGCNQDMTVHEMVGLLGLTVDRLKMLDLDSIRMRLEATKVKQEQDEAFQNMALKSKMSN